MESQCYLERIAKYLEESNGNLFYIATMKPNDNEDMSRIDNGILKKRKALILLQ